MGSLLDGMLLGGLRTTPTATATVEAIASGRLGDRFLPVQALQMELEMSEIRRTLLLQANGVVMFPEEKFGAHARAASLADGGPLQMPKAKASMDRSSTRPEVPQNEWWFLLSLENTGDSGDDIGTTARSYLRQVAAWRRMTRLEEEQQGFTLYQHLKDKAWIDAERLDMDQLASRNGVDYLVEWVRERYLDVQVTQVGRSLSGFFSSLRRKANQTVRDYMADFDRAHSRLLEVGCCLPDVAAAWVFVDRMGLEEQAELNLLASVGNQYSLKALQQAAIVHDRGLRKPWETQSRVPRKEWSNNKSPSRRTWPTPRTTTSSTSTRPPRTMPTRMDLYLKKSLRIYIKLT